MFWWSVEADRGVPVKRTTTKKEEDRRLSDPLRYTLYGPGNRIMTRIEQVSLKETNLSCYNDERR